MTIEYLNPDEIIQAKHEPLWYHLKHLSQTASGYGNKLSSITMIRLSNKRWYRIYMIQHSNASSAYIIRKGQNIFIGAESENKIQELMK